MTLKTIYIARHGFRLNWQTTTWKSPTGFPRDPPLAAYGEEQASELAAYMISLPERPTAIFSSPYYRCLQTAKPVAEALALPLFVEHGLGEWYSPVKADTGLHPRPVSASELAPFFPSLIDTKWTPTYIVSRKGETVQGLFERGSIFLKEFIKRIEQEAQGHECVLLVSHAATVITLATALLGDQNVGNTLRVGCCTLSTLVRDKEESDELIGEGVWRFEGTLADGSFLTKGIERDWGIADVETVAGVVVEDNGVPGSENETDVEHGIQVWNRAISPRM